MNKSAVILASDIGTSASIPNWPSNDLDGLFDAIQRWPLDTRLDFSNEPEFIDLPGSAPFRGRAWGHCVFQYNKALHRRVAVATKPIYPEFPDAVRFCGNFLSHSFGFWLDTADAGLIAKLDEAIAANIARQRDKEA